MRAVTGSTESHNAVHACMYWCNQQQLSVSRGSLIRSSFVSCHSIVFLQGQNTIYLFQTTEDPADSEGQAMTVKGYFYKTSKMHIFGLHFYYAVFNSTRYQVRRLLALRCPIPLTSWTANNWSEQGPSQWFSYCHLRSRLKWWQRNASGTISKHWWDRLLMANGIRGWEDKAGGDEQVYYVNQWVDGYEADRNWQNLRRL